jgi:hypothetical protein
MTKFETYVIVLIGILLVATITTATIYHFKTTPTSHIEGTR